MNTQQLLSIHEQLSEESRKIMEAKNHDYSGASGDPFANFRGSEFLGIHPVLGMQLRQQDKMMRVRTFVNKGELAVKNESVKDAILDQLNYLVLQYAYIVSTEGEKKNATKDGALTPGAITLGGQHTRVSSEEWQIPYRPRGF